MTVISKGQLIWRCRRGTKELDRILSAYLEDEYDAAPTELQNAFALLLEQQDPDIYDWLLGVRRAEDAALLAVIEKLSAKFPI